MADGTTTTEPHRRTGLAFQHEALLYDGQEGFLEGTIAFIREGLDGDEWVCVVVPGPKIKVLRDALGADANEVEFADMADVGANPATIIAAWDRFLWERNASGRRLRGIGEPAFVGRSPAELAECQQHETLLNVAFGSGPGWTLLCPYDCQGLQVGMVEQARRCHPFVREDGASRPSGHFHGAELEEPLAGPPLSPRPAPVVEIAFHAGSLRALRDLVVDYGERAGLGRSRSADLVLAVNEIAGNSIRHGGGSGCLRIWQDPGSFVCEIEDRGRVTKPLAGRIQPDDQAEDGRGLWLANHLCDLVQLRSSGAGTVVRLHLQTGVANRHLA